MVAQISLEDSPGLPECGMSSSWDPSMDELVFQVALDWAKRMWENVI